MNPLLTAALFHAESREKATRESLAREALDLSETLARLAKRVQDPHYYPTENVSQSIQNISRLIVEIQSRVESLKTLQALASAEATPTK